MTYSKLYPPKKHNVKPSWIIGYTTKHHLLLDLDNTSYTKVVRLVEQLMYEYSDIGDALIMETSTPTFKQQINYTPPEGTRIQTKRHNYHVIFGNKVSYEYSCQIIETLAHLGILDEAYTRIRMLRNDMTLRVNKTVLIDSVKSPPKFCAWIVNKYTEKRDNCMGVYINFWLSSRFL